MTPFEGWMNALADDGWEMWPLEGTDASESGFYKMVKKTGDGKPCYMLDVFYAVWWEGHYVWAGSSYQTGLGLFLGLDKGDSQR